MLACGPLPAAAAGTDYFPRQIPRPAAPAGRVAPLHAYLGATPAYWPQPLHWRYNHAGAPGPFSDDDAATIQQLIDASGKWMAVCGVTIVYDGETEATAGYARQWPTRPRQRHRLASAGGRLPGRHPLLDRRRSERRRHPRRRRHLHQSHDGDHARDPGVDHHARMGTRDRARPLAGRGHADVGPARIPRTPAAPSSRRTTCRVAAASTARRRACRRAIRARCPRRSTSAR